jgi:protein-disulfide isomerase
MLDKFGDKINTAFKNFPLDFHKNSAKEAQAALCVGQIAGADKYVDFHKKIFERTTGNGEGFSLDNLAPLAKEV